MTSGEGNVINCELRTVLELLIDNMTFDKQRHSADQTWIIVIIESRQNVSIKSTTSKFKVNNRIEYHSVLHDIMEHNGTNGHTVQLHDEYQYLNLIKHIIANGIMLIWNCNTSWKAKTNSYQVNKETIEQAWELSLCLVAKCVSV